MKLIRARLIQRIKRTPSVESFRFVPEERVEFTAGQFTQVIFDEANKDNKELNKYLSFSSSPLNEYIEVTKRLSDSKFSQRLRNLKINDTVLFKAPLGNCVFTDCYKKIAFLIGGIGITPVISIIEYIVGKKLDTEVVLLYSNRTDEEIAFMRELENWQFANSRIKTVFTVTECQPKDNKCIYGYINKALVSDNIQDIDERLFFIFGPPKMVEAMTGLCIESGVNKENVKTESFIGY